MDSANLVLLIDGYNVIAPVAPPGKGDNRRWLERERELLLTRLGENLPESIRSLTCVVFDAASPPAHAMDRYNRFGMDIRFAIDYPQADDLIEDLIQNSSAPKRLTLVSSDHRLQAAAKRRSAFAFDSEQWFDGLLGDRLQLAPSVMSKLAENRAGQGSDEKHSDSISLTQDEVKQWLRKFDCE